MNKEVVLNFINDVIIENGLENNLDSKTIKKSITKYKEYLNENGFADKEILKTISVIEEKSEEYIELARHFKQEGLEIPTIKVKREEKAKKDKNFDKMNEEIKQALLEGKTMQEVERIRNKYGAKEKDYQKIVKAYSTPNLEPKATRRTQDSCSRPMSRSC